MRGMLDPEDHPDQSHQINLYEKVGIDEYNIVARNRERHRTRHSNQPERRSAVFTVRNAQPDEPAKHPGQIISHVTGNTADKRDLTSRSGNDS